MKYQYVLKILNEKLNWEKKFLLLWKDRFENGDEASKRQAAGNIPSNEHRIKELTEAIDLLSK